MVEATHVNVVTRRTTLDDRDHPSMGKVLTLDFKVFAHRSQLTLEPGNEIIPINLSLGLYKTLVRKKESWTIEWFDNEELHQILPPTLMRSHRISIDPVIRAACAAMDAKGVHWEDVRGWGPFFRKQPAEVMPIRQVLSGGWPIR